MGRRTWLVVAGFLALNLVLWGGVVRYLGWGHPAAVLTCSAQDGVVVTSGSTITWRFDRTMRTTGHKDPGWIAPGGRCRWSWDAEATTLSAELEDLPPASVLHIGLDAGVLTAADGGGVRLPAVLSLTTPPPHLVAVDLQDRTLEGGYQILLSFDQEVVPAEVLSLCSLTTSVQHLARPIRLALGSATLAASGVASGSSAAAATGPAGSPAAEVRLVTEPLGGRLAVREGLAATLHLAAGLRGRSGALINAASADWPLRFDPQLRLESVSAGAAESDDQGGEGRQAILLHFNRPCSRSTVEGAVTVDPPVPFVISARGGEWALEGAFQCGQYYHVVIGSLPAGSTEEPPRPDRLPVQFTDLPPNTWFAHEAGYLGSCGNRTLLAHACNLRRVTLSAWRVYDDQLVAWRTTGYRAWSFEHFAQPVVTTTLTVDGPRNQVQELRVPLDQVLPPACRGEGVYRFALSWRWADASVPSPRGHEDETYLQSDWQLGQCLVSLSDLGLQAHLAGDGLDAWCWSLATTAPVAGTRVRVFSTKSQLLGEGLCDAGGWVHMPLRTPAAGEAPAVLIADRVADHAADRPDARALDQAGGRQAPAQLTWLGLDQPVRDALATTSGRPWLGQGLEAFVYAERGVWRPGEMVHLRALVRGGDGRPPAPMPVTWRLLRPDRRLWRELPARSDDHGDVTLDLPLPFDLATGAWTAELAEPGLEAACGSLLVEVDDFLPQLLRGTCTLGQSRSAAPVPRTLLRWPADQPIPCQVQADYRFGAPAARLEVRLEARLDPSVFSPQGWAEWTFGDLAETLPLIEHLTVTGQRLDVVPTAGDAQGRSSPHIDLAWLKHLAPALQARPWRLTAIAAVLEPSGRALTLAPEQLELDPLPAYAGLRLGLVDPASGALTASVRLVRSDGSRETGVHAGLTLRVYHEDWVTVVVHDHAYWRYESQRTLSPAGPNQAVELHEGAAELPLVLPGTGGYIIRLCDAGTGQVVSISSYRGGSTGSWGDVISREHPDRCEVLVAERQQSPPAPALADGALPLGAVAEVTVRSPFPGRLLLTVETDRVVVARSLVLSGNATTIAMPVEASWRPGVYISASVVRAVDPQEPWRVHRAFGQARVAVIDPQRHLQLRLSAPSEVRPGQPLDLTLDLSTSDGQAAAGAVATVAVVDEGVLALTGTGTPDPCRWFDAIRAPVEVAFDLYDQLMPEVGRPAGQAAPGGDGERGASMGRYRPPVEARRVRTEAWWSGALRADAQGRIALHMTPDETFAGSVRVVAVADGGNATGSTAASVLVRSGLVVSSSWPRVVAPGDAFVVPVTVHNRTAQAGLVALQLSLDAGGPLLPAAGSGTTSVSVPAAGAATVALQIRAGSACGVAHPRLVATLGTEQAVDALELPVRPAAPSEVVGGEVRLLSGTPTTAGLLDVQLPGSWLPGSTTLSAVIRPTPLLALPHGLEQLYRYPYGCCEQTTSACFPLVMLPELAATVDPGAFSAAGIRDRLQAAIDRLDGMQTADGGLSMWTGGSFSWPYGSIYSTHFLVEAARAGVPVPPALLHGLLTYCRRLGGGGQPAQALQDGMWLPGADLLEQAYAGYVLALAGEPDLALLERIEDELHTHQELRHEREQAAASQQAVSQQADDQSADERQLDDDNDPSVRMRLAAAWAAAGHADRALPLLPADLSTPTQRRHRSGDLASPVTDLALELDTLVTLQPTRAGLDHLAQALADASTWESTQDTAMAVMALGHFLRVAPRLPPYVSVALQVDGRPAAGAGSGESLRWSGTLATTLGGVATGPAGSGGWLSWLVCGVPLTPPPPSSNGLAVARSYRHEDGSAWEGPLRSGDLVLVELSVHAALGYQQVVIEDLLPGGLEVEDGRLAGTAASGGAKLPPAAAASHHHHYHHGQAMFGFGGGFGSGYDPGAEDFAVAEAAARVEIRDDRVVVMGNCRAGDGDWTIEHRYLARAVTSGTFLVPPLRAECMYDAAVSGCGPTGSLVIEPRP